MATLADILARKSHPSAPVITKESQTATIAGVIKEVLDARPMPVNKALHRVADPLTYRTLGYAEPGEQLPMELVSDITEEQAWNEARNSLSSELGILLEPRGEHAWLAVQPTTGNLQPILLFRLPLLYNNPLPGQPF